MQAIACVGGGMQGFANCAAQPVIDAAQRGTWTYYAQTAGPQMLRIVGQNVRYGINIVQADACQELMEGGGDDNDTNSTASALVPNGEVQLQNFCRAADIDVVKFLVEAGVTHAVTATNIGSAANVIFQQPQYCPSGGNLGGETAPGLTLTYTAAFNGVLCVGASNSPAIPPSLPTTYRLCES